MSNTIGAMAGHVVLPKAEEQVGLHGGSAGAMAGHVSLPQAGLAAAAESSAGPSPETILAFQVWLQDQLGKDKDPDIDAIAAKAVEMVAGQTRTPEEMRAVTVALMDVLRKEGLGKEVKDIEAMLIAQIPPGGWEDPAQEARFERMSLFMIIRLYLQFAAEQNKVNAQLEIQNIETSKTTMYEQARLSKDANKTEHTAGSRDAETQKWQGIFGSIGAGAGVLVGGFLGRKMGGGRMLNTIMQTMPTTTQLTQSVGNFHLANIHKQKLLEEQEAKDTRVEAGNKGQILEALVRTHEKSRQQGMSTVQKVMDSAAQVARKNDEIRSIV